MWEAARLQGDRDGHGLPPLSARHGVAVLARGVLPQLVLRRKHDALAVGRAAHPVLVPVVVCAACLLSWRAKQIHKGVTPSRCTALPVIAYRQRTPEQ